MAFDLKLNNHINLLDRLGFKESLFLWKDAILVMTDSGGLQEETTALGVPCITIRGREVGDVVDYVDLS